MAKTFADPSQPLQKSLFCTKIQPRKTNYIQSGFARAIFVITVAYCDRIWILCLRNSQSLFLDGDFFDLRVIQLSLTWPTFGNCGSFWSKLVSGAFSPGYCSQRGGPTTGRGFSVLDWRDGQHARSKSAGCSNFHQPIRLNRERLCQQKRELL